MKKLLAFLLAAATVFSMVGCQQENNPTESAGGHITQAPTEIETEPPTDPPTEPPMITMDAALAGVDISGMQAQEALEAIKAGLESYTLCFTISGKEYTATAEQLSITLNEAALLDYLTALEQGKTPERVNLAACDCTPLLEQIRKDHYEEAKNATVYYERAWQCYTYAAGSYGKDIDTDDLSALICGTVGALSGEATGSVTVYAVAPDHPSTSDKVQAAIRKANEYLTLQISYTYQAEGLSPTTVTMSKNDLASCLYINDAYELSISDGGVETYVAKMHSTYHGTSRNGYFKSTPGDTVYFNVKYFGEQIDTDAMEQSLTANLQARRSGTFNAPYHRPAGGEMAFGGSYVEVNLTQQRAWLYKNGVCLLSTPLVSGDVADNCCTPTGVYYVQEKARNCYLRGADYVTFVNYWIGFFWGYGLHDATWRYNFGGDIYLYNGSHGCVNLPYNNAATIYNNIAVGTPVIVYGGQTTIDPTTQELSGTSSYSLPTTAEPFKLDVSAKYAGGTLRYESSDPAVASVSEDGTVTIHSAGTATITVTAEAFESYTEARFQVTVTVHTACAEDAHQFTQWQTVVEPTCLPGEEHAECQVCHLILSRELAPVQNHTTEVWEEVQPPACGASGLESSLCSSCGTTQFRPIPALEHDYTSGGQYCDRGCGTENPDYEAPAETPTQTPTEPPTVTPTETPTTPPDEPSGDTSTGDDQEETDPPQE